MNFKSHPISSIFATLLDWTGQVVQLVFNYDDKVEWSKCCSFANSLTEFFSAFEP